MEKPQSLAHDGRHGHKYNGADNVQKPTLHWKQKYWPWVMPLLITTLDKLMPAQQGVLRLSITTAVDASCCSNLPCLNSSHCQGLQPSHFAT